MGYSIILKFEFCVLLRTRETKRSGATLAGVLNNIDANVVVAIVDSVSNSDELFMKFFSKFFAKLCVILGNNELHLNERFLCE